MSRFNADYALPPDERPPGMTRELQKPLQPGEVGEEHPSPADRPPPDPGVGFQIEADAIAGATKRLRALFDLVPLMDQISTATTDMAIALDERRWADFEIETGKLSSLAGHLVRAIEQRRPRKKRAS